MSKKEENPNAFKHWFNHDLLNRLSNAILQVHKPFDAKSFKSIAKNFKDLEMKPRVLAIRNSLKEHLPEDYKKALAVLLKAVEKGNLSGFDLWPVTEFVQAYGLLHPEESLKALYALTSRFTSEFAIRPFLVQDRKKTFSQMLKWSQDSDKHVRRWTSEGTRPRLPWGLKLHESIKNPDLGLQILENLKFDNELYVRKSVANHLNDISKDHPEKVVATLKSWRLKAKTSDEIQRLDWIQRHALRTLIKKGHKPSLKLMGYGHKAQIKLGSLKLNKNKLKVNEVLIFELSVQNSLKKNQKVALDYVIQYQRSGGKTSPKVFKWKVIDLKPGESLVLKKNHSLKTVTTRRDYPGLHKVQIQINGEVLASADWMLSL